MRAEQSKFLASISTDEGLSSAEEATRSAAVSENRESVQDVCSLCHDSNPENPLSFLIFLQVTSYIYFLFLHLFLKLMSVFVPDIRNLGC